MLKVSVTNVTKLSENSLCMALDQMKDSDKMYPVVEAELERRADFNQRLLKRKHKEQMESLLLTQAVQTQLEQILGSCRGNKMNLLIENFGQEYIEDYSVDEESFTVFTHVSDQGPWGFGTIEEAKGKLRELLYWRTYEKVLRDVDEESLELIATAMGVSLEVSNTVVVIDKRRSRG